MSHTHLSHPLLVTLVRLGTPVTIQMRLIDVSGLGVEGRGLAAVEDEEEEEAVEEVEEVRELLSLTMSVARR